MLVGMAQAGQFDAARVQACAFDIVAEFIVFKDLFRRDRGTPTRRRVPRFGPTALPSMRRGKRATVL